MALSPPDIHPSSACVPVLLSVPHAGRDYPDWLISLSKGGAQALQALEDPLVDDLVERAIDKGIGAVVARAPRAAIDCNRAEDEIDPTVIRSGPISSLSARARGGLGIIPGRTASHDKKLPVGEHPFQLYSLGTPNGQKVSIMFEELLELGHRDAEYDAWTASRSRHSEPRPWPLRAS